ncbi:unnamed protein product, partial [Arabidopsis halleri]
DSNLWPSVPKTDALTRLRYTSRLTVIAFFFHLPPALYGFLPSSFFHLNFKNPARSRLRVQRTKGPFFIYLSSENRSGCGFEPLTQGFTVLCSNHLSYLVHSCLVSVYAQQLFLCEACMEVVKNGLRTTVAKRH